MAINVTQVTQDHLTVLTSTVSFLLQFGPVQTSLLLPCGVLIIGTTCGNALLIACGLVDKKLRKKPSNLIVLSLASNDFMMGLLVISFTMVSTTVERPCCEFTLNIKLHNIH